MKTIRYGRLERATMTVWELRALLSAYADDMPVLAEWESLHTQFLPDCASVQKIGQDCEDALILYVDQR